MRALFVGGTVDNVEVEIDGSEPPVHYPPQTGSGQPRYRLQLVGRKDDQVVCAVYGAPDVAAETVRDTAEQRDYARRFSAQLADAAA